VIEPQGRKGRLVRRRPAARRGRKGRGCWGRLLFVKFGFFGITEKSKLNTSVFAFLNKQSVAQPWKTQIF
jgi:hypothetical protein